MLIFRPIKNGLSEDGEGGVVSNLQHFFVVKYFHSAGWAVYSLSLVVRSSGVQGRGFGLGREWGEGGRIREMWDPSRKMVEEGRKSRGRRAEEGVSVGGSLCAQQAKGAGTDVCVCVCRRGVVELFIQPGC